MQNNIRNTNLRFNLDKEQQRRAWEYLQTMDRQDFKSYSQVISIALVDYFDRYYRTQADLYLETREREELFLKQIVDAVENSLKQALPLFLSGLTAGMVQREPQIRVSFEELSKQYLMNTTTLKSVFKAVYGMPIASYMKEYRMKSASNMLLHEDKSISEIPAAVGYKSQSKFTSAFRDIFQILPTAYQKLYRNQ